MKIENLIQEQMLTEDDIIVDNILETTERVKNIRKRFQSFRDFAHKKDNRKKVEEVYDLLAEFEEDIDEIFEMLEDNDEMIVEAVQRQFRRYGDKFKRQYRCTTGQKAGRIVTQPAKCGIRKDPKRVRLGKRAARVKKGQRVRKTLFTKRKTQSKRLSRLNKTLRGEK